MSSCEVVTVKESNEDKKLGWKTIWHITAEETVNFKQSTFFVHKSDMPANMCAFVQQEKACGHPIEIIWQDTAIKNSFKRLEAQNSFWEHCLQDSSAEFLRRIGVYGDCSKAKSGDECCANTQGRALKNVQWNSEDSHSIDNLIPVTWKGDTMTWYEHAGHEISKFVKYLWSFGEAGIVKDKKDGKVGDREITVLLVW